MTIVLPFPVQLDCRALDSLLSLREVVIEETRRLYGDQLRRSATTGAGMAHDRC